MEPTSDLTIQSLGRWGWACELFLTSSWWFSWTASFESPHNYSYEGEFVLRSRGQLGISVKMWNMHMLSLSNPCFRNLLHGYTHKSLQKHVQTWLLQLYTSENWEQLSLPPTGNSKINFATAILCISKRAVEKENVPLISRTCVHSDTSGRSLPEVSEHAAAPGRGFTCTHPTH